MHLGLPDGVVLAAEIDLPTVEQRAEDLDALRQPSFPDRWRIEGSAHRLVLVRIVAGTESELEPTSRCVVERRDLLGEENRMTKVIVQDGRPQPDPVRSRCQVREDWQRGPANIDVIANEQDVEAGFLRHAGRPH